MTSKIQHVFFFFLFLILLTLFEMKQNNTKQKNKLLYLKTILQIYKYLSHIDTHTHPHTHTHTHTPTPTHTHPPTHTHTPTHPPTHTHTHTPTHTHIVLLGSPHAASCIAAPDGSRSLPILSSPRPWPRIFQRNCNRSQPERYALVACSVRRSELRCVPLVLGNSQCSECEQD